jgi:hypothetical protein
MACIRISNNGKIARETCPAEGRPGPDCCGGCGTTYYGNEFGDLWVDGGAANAGKYEDGDGNWHSVAGAGTTYCATGSVNAEHASSLAQIAGMMSVAITAQALKISLPANGAWWIMAVDGKGRTVVVQRIAGMAGTIMKENMPRGMYIIHAQSSWGAVSREVFVD